MDKIKSVAALMLMFIMNNRKVFKNYQNSFLLCFSWPTAWSKSNKLLINISSAVKSFLQFDKYSILSNR